MATKADYDRIGNYARVLNPQQNIDRSKAHRTVPMQVLCLGYSRAGTLSMHSAMTTLGYPNPYHFSSILDNVVECDLWMQALRTKYWGSEEVTLDKAFWDGLLGHVSAVTDAPCILFGQELLAAYPDAKVVLVEREIDSWFKSWMAFCENAYEPSINFLAKLDPFFLGRIVAVGFTATQVLTGFSQNKMEARARSKAAYRHHYMNIREFVPESQLLNFRLDQGWKPLCDFLGKPVPDVPFPHANETEANKLSFEMIGKQGLKNIARNASVMLSAIVVPVVAVWWLRR